MARLTPLQDILSVGRQHKLQKFIKKVHKQEKVNSRKLVLCLFFLMRAAEQQQVN